MLRHRFIVCSITMVGAVSLIAMASPFLPSAQVRESDRIVSLARIEEVSTQVQSLPPDIRQAGLTVKQVQQQLAKHLRTAGFKVTEANDVPVVDIRIMSVTESAVPDGVAYSVTLLVLQAVTVERLNANLVVPTYVVGSIGLEPRGKLRDAVRANIEAIVGHLAERMKDGSEYLARKGE